MTAVVMDIIFSPYLTICDDIDTIANDYYTSNKELGEDLAKAINLELNRLVDAGCKYIQVDEPLFARKPKEAIEYGVENLEKCFDGIIIICCWMFCIRASFCIEPVRQFKKRRFWI